MPRLLLDDPLVAEGVGGSCIVEEPPVEPDAKTSTKSYGDCWCC